MQECPISYHVYMEPTVGEVSLAKPALKTTRRGQAVAVFKEKQIVGHVPVNLSFIIRECGSTMSGQRSLNSTNYKFS